MRLERGRVVEDAVGAQLAAECVADLAHAKFLKVSASAR